MKVSAVGTPKKKGRLFHRFEKSLKLQYKGLESLIGQLKSSKKEKDIEDTVRLWIAYIFALFLAPKSNQTCPRDVNPFLDDLSQLESFAWIVFIKNLTVEVLLKIADYLRSGEPCKAKRVDKERRQPTLLGYSIGLVVWFMEHINIRSPFDPSIFSRLLRIKDKKWKKEEEETRIEGEEDNEEYDDEEKQNEEERKSFRKRKEEEEEEKKRKKEEEERRKIEEDKKKNEEEERKMMEENRKKHEKKTKKEEKKKKKEREEEERKSKEEEEKKEEEDKRKEDEKKKEYERKKEEEEKKKRVLEERKREEEEKKKEEDKRKEDEKKKKIERKKKEKEKKKEEEEERKRKEEEEKKVMEKKKKREEEERKKEEKKIEAEKKKKTDVGDKNSLSIHENTKAKAYCLRRRIEVVFNNAEGDSITRSIIYDLLVARMIIDDIIDAG
ncbi:hypothetical protein COCNU_05G000070 [Cocos nucifera]|uniref:Uncharacterized protein n=1 Tax=Cocos nucifera TaxID=13894 RepID=A0A8K0I7I1_COCNU|nr:hypothetical protein COCNU_05G000070 [Cocos nucifera]